MAYSDDQAEIDSMMSSPMANMTGSIPTSELNANISGLRSTINALSQQVVSLSKSTASVATQFAKQANKEYGIDGRAMGQSIAGAIAGPLGVVFTKTLSESGVGERIGAGLKNSIGSLVSKFRSNKPDYQSGFLDPSSMSKISNQNTRVLTDTIGTDINKPLVEANRIAQLELNETRKGNTDITSAVRNVSTTISDTSESYTESIISALENLGTKFEDSQAKGPANPFVDFAKSIFWSSKIGTLFKGKYTNDITRSKNPLETQVSALLQIYRWQRLYGELTKNQFNEIIRLMGGQEKDVVGKHSLLKDFWLRNKKDIKKKIGNGFQTKLIDFFMYDEEDRDDRNRAAMAAGLGQTLNGNRKKLFDLKTILSGEDDKESALGYAKGLNTDLMSAEQLQRASDELSSRFNRYQKASSYGEWIKPDVDYKSVKAANDAKREEIQKIKDNLTKRRKIYNPLNWFDSKEKRIEKSKAEIAKKEAELNTNETVNKQIKELKDSKKSTTDKEELKAINEQIKALKKKLNTETEESLQYKRKKFYNGVDPELYESYGGLPKVKGINISHNYNNTISPPPSSSNKGGIFKPVSPNPLYNSSLEGLITGSIPVTIMGYSQSDENNSKSTQSIIAKAKQLSTIDIAKKDPESLKISLPVATDPQTALLQTVAKSTAITAAAASKSAHYQEKIFKDDQEDESEAERNRRWQREWDKKQKEKERGGGDGSGGNSFLDKAGRFIAPVVGVAAGAWGGWKLANWLNPFKKDENVKESTKDAFAMNGSVAGAKGGMAVVDAVTEAAKKTPIKKVPGFKTTTRVGKFLGKTGVGALNVVNTGLHAADGISRISDGQSVRGTNQMINGVTNWIPGGGLITSMYGDLATEFGDSVQGKVSDLTAKATLKDGTVLETNKANRVGDNATLMAQRFGTVALPAATSMTAHGLQTLGTTTSTKLLTNAGTKLGTFAASKAATKILPGIGTALTAVDVASRIKEGDKAGALLSAGAGAAAFIPPPVIGLGISVALSCVLMICDILDGIKQMKAAENVQNAMNDPRFFMDSNIANQVQKIGNDKDLSDGEKLILISNIYKKWRSQNGKPEQFSEEVGLMCSNRIFMKNKDTHTAFIKIEELCKKAKLSKQVAFRFKIAYYDKWKIIQVKRIGLGKVIDIVQNKALKDKEFCRVQKEKIKILNKALKKHKLDHYIYYGDLYYMYYNWVNQHKHDKNGNNQYADLFNDYAIKHEEASKPRELTAVDKALENGGAVGGSTVNQNEVLAKKLDKAKKSIEVKETPVTEKATEAKKETEIKPSNSKQDMIDRIINEQKNYVNPQALEYYGKEKLEKEPWHNYEEFRYENGKLIPIATSLNSAKMVHNMNQRILNVKESGKHKQIAGEPILLDKPLSEKQLDVMERSLKTGYKYEPQLIARYEMQKKGNIKVVSDNSTAQNMQEVKKNQQLEASNKVYSQTKALEGTTKAVKDGTDRAVAAGNVNAAKISNSVSNVTNVINNNNSGGNDNDNPTLYQPNIASNVMNV